MPPAKAGRAVRERWGCFPCAADGLLTVAAAVSARTCRIRVSASMGVGQAAEVFTAWWSLTRAVDAAADAAADVVAIALISASCSAMPLARPRCDIVEHAFKLAADW